MTREIRITTELLSALKDDAYAGYDPFDLLNSKLLKATPLYKSELIRLVWLQVGKRSPINLRPLLAVPKRRNPKGIGLIISGLLEDYKRTSEASYLEEATALGEWLLENRCDPEQWKHSCWGYHFDWQARAFYVPAGKPNIITTVYVARALRDLHQASGEDRFLQAAISSASFLTEFLFNADAEGGYFSYIPGETAFVHNASLWGAAWCTEVGFLIGDDSLKEKAAMALERSVSAQADDGSWVYGTRSHHQFIDSFHTGYNLEALSIIRKVTGNTELDSVIKRGYQYYKETFFLADGTARYYNNNTYPIDFHCVSQALLTFLEIGGKDDIEMCDKVIDFAVSSLYDARKKMFIYQKNRFFDNRINYIRWTQAWAYYSLSKYNRMLSDARTEAA